VRTPNRRIRLAALATALAAAGLLSAGCTVLSGGGVALDQQCLLGCETPDPPLITPTSVRLSGPAYLNIRGKTSGGVAARTTTVQLETTNGWVDLETTVGSGTGANNERDLWSHIFIDHKYRAGIAAADHRPNIRIVESDGTSVVQRVIRADRPDLVVSPPNMRTFTATVGASQVQEVEIRNGSSTLGLDVTYADVRPQSPFSVEVKQCVALRPGARCSLLVTFAPTRAGLTTARLHIDSDDPRRHTVALEGTGVAAAAPAPRVTLSPASLTLGELQEGVVTVTNPGATAVTTGTAAITDPTTGAVFFTTPGADPARDCWGGTTLAAGASCDVTVTFSGAPPSPPDPQATLSIPVTGGQAAAATLHGTLPSIMSSAVSTAAARRAKPARVHFAGRLSTATRIAAAGRQTGGARLAIDLTGAVRTTTTAPKGTAVPAALKRLLGSRFSGAGTLAARGTKTSIDTIVLTAPAKGGRLCARLRIAGTRTAATGTLTVLGGTGPAAGLRATSKFELFKGDRATGIATVSTGRARPMPATCTT